MQTGIVIVFYAEVYSMNDFDDKNKNENAEIDAILNEIRKQRGDSGEKNAEAAREEENFVDISSFAAEPDESESAPDGAQGSSAASDNELVFEGDAQIAEDEPREYYMTAKAEPKTKKKGKKGLVAIGVAAMLVLLGCSFYAAYALNPDVVPAQAPVPVQDDASSQEAKEFVFAKGVSIEGIDISGKNQKEAKALIKIKESDFKEDFSLKVNYGDGKKLTYNQDDFSCTYNTDDVFEQALQYSRDVGTAAQNGTLDQLVPPDKSNVTVDEEKGTIDFGVSCIINDASIDKVVKRIAGKIDQKAVEPHAEKYDPYAKSFEKMFKWVKGKNGIKTDKEALTDDIKELFKNGAVSGEVTAETTTEKPKHSMEDVKNNVQLIGQFSTISYNTVDATSNMAVALKATDASIIDPGEVFSFNECTGDSNLTENGYLPAAVIANGQYETGVGGGICQSATTIYNAMLLSGMEVVQRAYHYFSSAYVYAGIDATIDYPYLDMQMKNTTDYQIFLHTWMDGVTLHCEVYGWQSPEWDEVRTESWCTYDNYDSFGFSAQRVYYKNNKEVKRDDLPDSVYSHDGGHPTVSGDPGNVSNKIKDPKKNLKIS